MKLLFVFGTLALLVSRPSWSSVRYTQSYACHIVADVSGDQDKGLNPLKQYFTVEILPVFDYDLNNKSFTFAKKFEYKASGTNTYFLQKGIDYPKIFVQKYLQIQGRKDSDLLVGQVNVPSNYVPNFLAYMSAQGMVRRNGKELIDGFKFGPHLEGAPISFSFEFNKAGSWSSKQIHLGQDDFLHIHLFCWFYKGFDNVIVNDRMTDIEVPELWSDFNIGVDNLVRFPGKKSEAPNIVLDGTPSFNMGLDNDQAGNDHDHDHGNDHDHGDHHDHGDDHDDDGIPSAGDEEEDDHVMPTLDTGNDDFVDDLTEVLQPKKKLDRSGRQAVDNPGEREEEQFNKDGTRTQHPTKPFRELENGRSTAPDTAKPTEDLGSKPTFRDPSRQGSRSNPSHELCRQRVDQQEISELNRIADRITENIILGEIPAGTFSTRRGSYSWSVSSVQRSMSFYDVYFFSDQEHRCQVHASRVYRRYLNLPVQSCTPVYYPQPVWVPAYQPQPLIQINIPNLFNCGGY